MLWDIAKLQPRWWPPNFHAVVIIVMIATPTITVWTKYVRPVLVQTDWNSAEILRLNEARDFSKIQRIRMAGDAAELSLATQEHSETLVKLQKDLAEHKADAEILYRQQRDNADAIDQLIDWIVRARRQINRIEHRVTELHVSRFGTHREFDPEDTAP